MFFSSNNKIDLYFNLLKYNPYTHILTYVYHGNNYKCTILICIPDFKHLGSLEQKMANKSNSVDINYYLKLVLLLELVLLLDIMSYTSSSGISIIESIPSNIEYTAVVYY